MFSTIFCGLSTGDPDKTMEITPSLFISTGGFMSAFSAG
jgi:hypothetical protein